MADYLRDGVYELRFKYRNVNYRIFYGFIGRQIALVSHVATKLDKVAEKDIDTAASRLQLAQSDRDTYTAEMDLPDG
jgi:phage-related protein